MRSTLRRLVVPCAIGALSALASSAHATDVETKVQDFGPLPASFTTSYGSSFSSSSIAPSDTFYEDYKFSVSSGSFSSVTATFDLGTLFNIVNLSARLLSDPTGSIGTSLTPGTIGSASVLERWSATVASSSGSGTYQAITPYSLSAGRYVLEVRGNVVGDVGGSYAGVFNVAAVPEASGAMMAVLGFGLLALAWRRR